MRKVKALIKRWLKQLEMPGLTAAFLFSILIICTSNADVGSKSTAQEHSLGLGFGQVILMGDFEKNFSDSIGYDLTYDYNASEIFGIYVDASYHKHRNASGENTAIIKGLAPSLKANFAYVDKLTVYGLAGLGLYWVGETTGEIAGSVTTFGFNAGPGAELRLDDHLKFGTNVGFYNLFTKSDTEAKNPFGKGMTIGGTFVRLFINISYIF